MAPRAKAKAGKAAKTVTAATSKILKQLADENAVNFNKETTKMRAYLLYRAGPDSKKAQVIAYMLTYIYIYIYIYICIYVYMYIYGLL